MKLFLQIGQQINIICSINNDIPIEIPNHPYVLVNRSILCNYGIEGENNYLLESLAICHDSRTKVVMNFIVNLAFTDYLNDFNLMEEISIPTITNKPTLEVTLSVFSNKSKFDESLLSVPLTLKEYIFQYEHDKEIFYLNEKHDVEKLKKNLLTEISLIVK